MLTAHIASTRGGAWLYVTNHATNHEPIVTFDAPLNLSTKATTKAEIDFAHERSGISRGDLYDAVRTYQRSRRI